MILLIQMLLLYIGLAVFVMQHRMKKSMSIVASKLIYWTTLLFISMTFNRILLEFYPDNYSLYSYLGQGNFQLVIGVFIGYVILQLMAPSRSIVRLVEKLKKKLKIKGANGIYDVGEDKETHEKDSYLKEIHFETFLETLCWFGIVLTVIMEILTTIISYFPEVTLTYMGLNDVVCMLMMISIPITIRQIIFYLYRIRSIKEEEHLTEVERSFQKKLRQEHMKL